MCSSESGHACHNYKLLHDNPEVQLRKLRNRAFGFLSFAFFLIAVICLVIWSKMPPDIEVPITSSPPLFGINYSVSNFEDFSIPLKRPVILLPDDVPQHSLSIVCYYVLNDTFLTPEKLNFSLCTHINIGFAYINQFNAITFTDEALKPFIKFQSLSQKVKNVKKLLSVTGGESSYFSSMVTNHSSRKTFIRSVMSFIKTYHLDGLDLDWEWPVINGGVKEKVKFIQLLHELRSEFSRHEKKYLLSAAVGAAESIITAAYYVQHINEHVDYVNVMTYDFHSFNQFFPVTDFNAPLYANPQDYGGALENFNVNFSINYWISLGMPREKIMLGLPTYGHTYRLRNGINHQRHAPAEGYGFGDGGFVAYEDVCRFLRSLFTTRVWDNASLVPYCFDYHNWVSYDDAQSLIIKTKYAKEQALGGVMIYSMNADDYEGHCHNIKFPLLKAIKDNS